MDEKNEDTFFSAYNPGMSLFYNIYILPDKIHIATAKVVSADEDGIDEDRFKPITPQKLERIQKKLKKYEQQLSSLPESNKEERRELQKKIKNKNFKLQMVSVLPKSSIQSIIVKKKWSDCGLTIEMKEKKKVLFFSSKDVRRFNFDKNAFETVCELFQANYGSLLTIESK